MQILEKNNTAEDVALKPKIGATVWCDKADEWSDDNTSNEENGNMIKNAEKVSDEDEESCSLEDSIHRGFAHMTFHDSDKNANKGSQG